MVERKVYYSFHDMPSSQGITQSYTSGSRLRFSRTEVMHILIAIGVLTVAFSFAITPGYPSMVGFFEVVEYIPLAFIAIVTAFFCHEMAHKYMGQKYGYWSEFRMFPMGLLFALFLGVAFGFVFAAPGAVQIFGNANREEEGKISVAGPLMNLIVALLCLPVMYISSDVIKEFVSFICYINAFLAFFNLIPFGPLDGGKILRWRLDVWASLIAVSIGLIIIVPL